MPKNWLKIIEVHFSMNTCPRQVSCGSVPGHLYCRIQAEEWPYLDYSQSSGRGRYPEDLKLMLKTSAENWYILLCLHLIGHNKSQCKPSANRCSSNVYSSGGKGRLRLIWKIGPWMVHGLVYTTSRKKNRFESGSLCSEI